MKTFSVPEASALVLTVLAALLAGCETPVTLTGVSASTTAARSVYGIGEEFDPAGWTITLKYDDGSSETVAWSHADAGKFRFGTLDSATPGAGRSVAVTYDGKTTAITGLSVYPFVGQGGAGTEADPFTWTGYHSFAGALQDAAGRKATITLYQDPVPLPAGVFYTLDTPGTDITLIGFGAERTIRRDGSNATDRGQILAVGNLSRAAGSAVKLTLGRNITLRGRQNVDYTSDSMVTVNATFTMLSGSKITGHYTERSTGAVAVGISGVFTMKGGEITGNRNLDNQTTKHTNAGTGGVGIGSSGKFIMEGGSVHDNVFAPRGSLEAPLPEGERQCNIALLPPSTATVARPMLILRGSAIVDSIVITYSSAENFRGNGQIAVSSGWTGRVGEVNFFYNNPVSEIVAAPTTNDEAAALVSAAWKDQEFIVTDPDAEGYDAVEPAEMEKMRLGRFYGVGGSYSSASDNNRNRTYASAPVAGFHIGQNPNGGASLVADAAP